MDIARRFSEQLKSAESAPFLFVGSGLSRRYIKLETWEALLKRFADGLPYPFDYYRSRADGDMPRIASLIAESFHEVWWKSDRFEESRKIFAEKAGRREDCLKFEISRYMAEQKFAQGKKELIDREVALLRRCIVDGIITTNWDTFLESVFPDFTVFVGQGSILSSHPQGVAEIYKIHGCSTDPSSLVLTHGDYEEFEKKNPYLAAKLLTIFVEHPVIFMGYSMSDPNIQSILRQVGFCLSSHDIQRLRDRLVFVQWSGDGGDESLEATVMHVGEQTIPVTVARVPEYSGLFEALSSFRRRFPARLLRSMKEHVYDLVKSNDPKEKIFVVDIEEAEDFSDVEVVYGVGVSEKIGAIGYAPIEVMDLMKDVVEDDSSFDPDRIVRDTLPSILRRGVKYVPMFRYLSSSGYFSDKKLNAELDGRIRAAMEQGASRFNPPQQYRKKGPEIRKKYKSLAAVLADVDAEHAIFFIPLLDHKKIDVQDLKQFIVANMNLLNSPRTNTRTYFRSLICLYDWLGYGRAYSSAESHK